MPIRAFLWLLLGLPILLSACATVLRTPNTNFVIQTLPAGASVTTDLKILSTAGNATAYYGCAPTPCSIKLPRRSDFNVLVVKSGYQPFTYAITKDRNKEVAKRNAKANITIGAGASTALIVSSAGALPALSLPAAGAIAGAVALPAVPVIGLTTGIDLASGALIDLYPNPLNVAFASEVTPEQTAELIEAFHRSRQKNAKQN